MAINDPNQQQSQQPKQTGTGFTNLQSIMQANQGNKLGQAVGSGVQQTGQQVQQGLQQGQQDFSQQSAANQLGTAQQRENVSNVLSDPTKASAQDVSNFAQYRAGNYAGPTGLGNISNLTGQAQQAQQQGQSLGSDTGRQSLLQRYAANPSQQYGAGAQRLDTLLLGSGNQQPLQQARKAVSGLNQQVAGGEQAAEQQAQQYQQQAKQFGQDVTQQTSGAESGIYNPAQQAAVAANIKDTQTQLAAENAAQAAQEKGQLSADALAALGLTAGQRTYGANLGADIGYKGGDAATAMNVMSPQDFQKYSALRGLMGESAVQQSQNPYTAGQVTYNKAQAASDIASQQQKYQGDLQNQGNVALGLATSYTGPRFDLSTPEGIQNQIDWLRGAHGDTWQGNLSGGSQGSGARANQAAAAQLQSVLNDTNNRYGGLATLMQPPTDTSTQST